MPRTHAHSSVLLLMTLALCGGCDDRPAEPGFDDDLQARTGSLSFGWGCRECGGNSPSFGLHALNEFGVDSTKPFAMQLLGIRDYNGDEYPVTIVQGHLVADMQGGMFMGIDLVGWTLLFKTAGQVLEVDIYSYADIDDWAQHNTIPTYGLGYEDLSSGEPAIVSVCPGINVDETSVVFLNDERYDTVNSTVIPNQPGWVTAACRGHALAKMKLLGYDPDGEPQYQSTALERQATLKMITADYCGDGSSMTVFGQKINWMDSRGYVPPDYGEDPTLLEARWDHNGAMCLDTPRLHTRTHVQNACTRTIEYCNGDIDPNQGVWHTQRG